MCMSVSAPYVCWRPKGCIGGLKLELQMIVSLHMGAGNHPVFLTPETSAAPFFCYLNDIR